jgi:hypothetical protein
VSSMSCGRLRMRCWCRAPRTGRRGVRSAERDRGDPSEETSRTAASRTASPRTRRAGPGCVRRDAVVGNARGVCSACRPDPGGRAGTGRAGTRRPAWASSRERGWGRSTGAHRGMRMSAATPTVRIVERAPSAGTVSLRSCRRVTLGARTTRPARSGGTLDQDDVATLERSCRRHRVNRRG